MFIWHKVSVRLNSLVTRSNCFLFGDLMDMFWELRCGFVNESGYSCTAISLDFLLLTVFDFFLCAFWQGFNFGFTPHVSYICSFVDGVLGLS